jgi:hypothetical protein
MSYDSYDNNDMQEGIGDSLLDIDTSGAQEPMAVEPDQEYEIRITGFVKDKEAKIVRTSDSGFKYFIISFDIPSEEYSKSFTQIYSVPTPEMEPKRANAAKWDLECLKRCFGLDSINFSAMIGRTGAAILGRKTEEGRGESNYIKKLVTGA